MKKIVLMFFVSLLFTAPVFANKWKEIETKRYVDLDSIKKFEDKKRSKKYTFWIKSLNDKSSYFQGLEKSYDTRIWYTLTKNIVDCKNNTIALKAIVIYDLNSEIVDNIENKVDKDSYKSITPSSIGEMYYYGVCPMNIKLK